MFLNLFNVAVDADVDLVEVIYVFSYKIALKWGEHVVARIPIDATVHFKSRSLWPNECVSLGRLDMPVNLGTMCFDAYQYYY